jgi:hypothetical protein
MLDYVGSVRQWPESSNIRGLGFLDQLRHGFEVTQQMLRQRAENGLMVRGQRDCRCVYQKLYPC